MLTLKNLKSPKGAHRNTKRIGRGQGSGQGTQAGKGGKGQTARKSGPVKTGFEGGQMPLYRRLPKKGFLNHPFKQFFSVVNLSQLSEISGNEVTREVLVGLGLIKGSMRSLPIKILGSGELQKALSFIGIERFTKSAEEKIQKAGGKIVAKRKD